MCQEVTLCLNTTFLSCSYVTLHFNINPTLHSVWTETNSSKSKWWCCPLSSWVGNLQSLHFHRGLYILVKYDIVTTVVGKMIDLVTVDNALVICVQECYCYFFSSYYNAFAIRTKSFVSAIYVYSIADHCPFHTRFNFYQRKIYIWH